MQEELKSSDYKSTLVDSSLITENNFIVKEPSLKASLKALMYKSFKLQSRHCCSNVCQIITPIICLLFTIFVKIIVQGITTGAVNIYSFPQPFNLPFINEVVRSQLNLSCTEIYYYQSDYSSQDVVNQILRFQLKNYCAKEQIFDPLFIKKDRVTNALMERLKQADMTAFERGDDLKTEIPDGMIIFTNSSKTKLSATLSINDFRLPQYHKNNGVTKILIKTSNTSVIGTYLRVTEALMSLIDKITRPYLQMMDTPQKQIITGSFMYMPFSGEDTSLVDKVVNIVGSGLYPLGLSLLMPILLYMVVSEKEQRQIQIMKMNGLDSKHYWVNFFIVSFILSMLTSLNMYLVGTYIIDITFFKQTSGLLLWIMFVGWAIAQIALTSLVQIFIGNSKTATIVGYLLSIFSTLIGEVITTVIFPLPMTFPLPLLIFPPFALCRIVYYMGWACSDTAGCYRSVSGIDSEMVFALVILYSWFGVYLLSIWLNQIIQQQYGVAKNPKLIEKCLQLFRKKRHSELLQQEIQPSSSSSNANDINEIELANMQNSHLGRKDDLIDQSVFKHREDVFGCQIDQALIIKDISKKYPMDNGEKDKIALQPLTMRMMKGEIFGFLGPNGAGKTTLISVITGMYPQTSGNAWIGGRQIGYSSTNQLIGVCPQFDILWPELTVEEHIRFYSKLKQVNEQEIDGRVQELLKEVDLYSQRGYYIRQLSGGMQRRVSIACALSGSPSVVILDEPSSGLDPYHRREIWKILLRCKRRTSIFMTSHLMDQVEFLCDRIGIISQGQLRCIGDLRTLKNKFGKGYRLTISYPAMLRSEQSARPLIVQQLIQKLNLQIVSQLETRVVLKIERRDLRECIEQLKSEANIDWFINQPSLYDVFMHFVR